MSGVFKMTQEQESKYKFYNNWIGTHRDDIDIVETYLSIICNEFDAEVISNIYEEKNRTKRRGENKDVKV